MARSASSPSVISPISFFDVFPRICISPFIQDRLKIHFSFLLHTSHAHPHLSFLHFPGSLPGEPLSVCKSNMEQLKRQEIKAELGYLSIFLAKSARSKPFLREKASSLGAGRIHFCQRGPIAACSGGCEDEKLAESGGRDRILQEEWRDRELREEGRDRILGEEWKGGGS